MSDLIDRARAGEICVTDRGTPTCREESDDVTRWCACCVAQALADEVERLRAENAGMRRHLDALYELSREAQP